MSRMFIVDGKSMKTWNVWVGCKFNCTYCNARKLALTRLKHIPRYKNGFEPHLVESELSKKFKPGDFIFCAYMGDLSFASYPDMVVIFNRIIQFPETRFLLQSKDPSCFSRWQLDIPPNVYLGTTIETNRDYKLTKAPPPVERFRALREYPHPHKFLSIEPIQDFDPKEFIKWIEIIKPDIIEVGYDNYGNRLIEPRLDKTLALIKELEKFAVVKRKTIRRAWNE